METRNDTRDDGSLHSSDNIKRCGFYVKRKRRNCRMLPAKGNTYCAEHLCFQDQTLEFESSTANAGGHLRNVVKKRVKCPLDPNHTVYEDRLEKHLKKCNSRQKSQQEFFEKNINSGLLQCPDTDDEKVSLSQIPKEDIFDLITRVTKCFIESNLKIGEFHGAHQVLKGELENEEYGESTKKHFIQQASLIDILEQNGVFKENTAFLELGAGKGKLSHWLQKAVGSIEDVDFFLIDRQNHRNKFDCYHKGEDQGPSFKRLYIDIEHLNLGKVPDLNEKEIVGIGKHLCGGASDLSLRCLVERDKNSSQINQSSKKPRIEKKKVIKLILLALCCYHRCSWPSYVGREFLARNGFNMKDFNRMTKMCSWAVCGFHHSSKGTECAKSEEPPCDNDTEINVFQLSPDEKKEIGWKCKRLIDLGRIDYLSEHGYDTRLLQYVDSKVTLENIVLLAKPKDVVE